MSLFHILIVVCITGSSWTQGYGGIETNDLNENDYEVKLFGNDEYLTMFKYITRDVEKVHIQIYYECLCPDCIQFDVDQFSPVLETMNQYLDIHTYPYGNAKTIEENGKIYFKCQHGPPECYGNKLHACALDNLQHTTALRFNVCLMNSTEGQGSDDKTADECGKSMGQDSEAIKACAKGNRGTELLKYYGEQNTGRAMSLFDIIIVIFILTNCSWTQSYTGFESNYLNGNDYEAQFYGNNIYLTMSKYIPRNAEKVNIQIFYECLCPCCKQFDVNQLSPVLETMNQYLNIYTYPYGNAKTIEDYNGNIDFKCQHGPLECYGNKLHACALDNLEHTTALRFNICLMNVTEGGSDDNTADECGQLLGINPEGIKACAKGNRGTQLLQYYGEESKKANFRHVPYILINGKEYNVKDSNFKAAVCAAFTDPPPACRSEW